MSDNNTESNDEISNNKEEWNVRKNEIMEYRINRLEGHIQFLERILLSMVPIWPDIAQRTKIMEMVRKTGDLQSQGPFPEGSEMAIKYAARQSAAHAFIIASRYEWMDPKDNINPNLPQP